MFERSRVAIHIPCGNVMEESEPNFVYCRHCGLLRFRCNADEEGGEVRLIPKEEYNVVKEDDLKIAV